MRKFFFAKILRMTKYTSLPTLVRLGQWEQVFQKERCGVILDPQMGKKE